jgi:hypothetical protein
MNVGHVRSKTKSPGQILENPCLHFKGHISDPIFVEPACCELDIVVTMAVRCMCVSAFFMKISRHSSNIIIGHCLGKLL